MIFIFSFSAVVISKHTLRAGEFVLLILLILFCIYSLLVPNCSNFTVEFYCGINQMTCRQCPLVNCELHPFF